ncbi:MAG TPA: hypothetical protein VGD55_04460, partial [Acidothermaceae bacterium]
MTARSHRRSIANRLLFSAAVGYVGLIVGLAIAYRWASGPILTAALVGLTGYYAMQTQRTVTEMR